MVNVLIYLFVCLFVCLLCVGDVHSRSVNEWLMYISYPECGYAWTYDVTAGAVAHVCTLLVFMLTLVLIQKTAVLRDLYVFVNFSKWLCVQVAQINRELL